MFLFIITGFFRGGKNYNLNTSHVLIYQQGKMEQMQ